MAAFPAASPTSRVLAGPLLGDCAAPRLAGGCGHARSASPPRVQPTRTAFLVWFPSSALTRGMQVEARGRGLFLSTLAWGRGALLQLEKEGQSSRLACSRGQACAGGARLRQASPLQ